jgi:hypothetical protein
MATKRDVDALYDPDSIPVPESIKRRPATGGPGNGQAGDPGPAPAPPPQDPPWPRPLAAEAFHGLAGRVVRAVEPASESDPAAILFQTLVLFGSAAGRNAFFAVEADRHYPNEYVVLVGKTSKGRKGTSFGQARRLVAFADGEWSDERIQTGLSSGEGLIWGVRDKVSKMERLRGKEGGPPRYEEVEFDPGVKDKRLMVYEPEYASVLRQVERQGNTLSAVVRQAWDGGNLRSLVKNCPARSTDAHVSLVGHVTVEELRRYLTVTEMGNGFANRNLFVCVGRSKLLPEGGTVDPAEMAAVQEEFVGALAFAKEARRLKRDDAAREIWRDVYGPLSEGRPGLSGALLGRAEAHVTRLSLIYALLDKSEAVGAAHLLAALGLWRYAEASVLHVFGDSLGDPVADELLRLLRASPKGLTRTDINAHFGRHQTSERIGQALRLLAGNGLARFEREETSGRPVERWRATGA